MPERERGLYASTCNPSRRAKRAPTGTSLSTSSDLSSTTQQARVILPMRPYAPRIEADPAVPSTPPPPPAKRGRKPGPLSRTAREAQRRLNHSIIEKARRTKINDALATLKQLVPPDYAQVKSKDAETEGEEEEEEEEGDNDEDYASAKKSKQKPKSKREEKEKEFKLEILIRTVVFLQDLLQRVSVLESKTPTACRNCSGSGKDSKKRKRAGVDLENASDGISDIEEVVTKRPSPRRTKKPRAADKLPTPPATRAQSSPSPGADVDAPVLLDTGRLPSISSWLPNLETGTQLLRNKPYTKTPPMTSYLPSPPFSTHPDIIRTMTQVPPVLNLGPVATAAMVMSSTASSANGINQNSNSSARTPEDESAASLLLQIATSPSFRPVSSSSPPYPLPDPSNFLLHSDMRSQGRDRPAVRQQAQTPGSILGLSSALGLDRMNGASTKI